MDFLFFRDWSKRKKKDPQDLFYEDILELSLFSTLKVSEFKKIRHMLFIRKFRKGEFVFREETPGHALFILKEGSIGLELVNDAGAIRQVSILHRGSFLGELALVSAGKRKFSAKALTDVTVVVFFEHDFLKLVDRYPRIGARILIDVVRLLGGRLLDQCNSSVDEVKSNKNSFGSQEVL